VAEGRVVVEKLADSALHQPLSLLIASKRVDALHSVLSRLSDEVPVYVAAQRLIDAIAGFPLHRGILAISRRTDIPTADDLLSAYGVSIGVQTGPPIGAQKGPPVRMAQG
jgi:tRNA G18 (ribose-2'-O)-methylase SpoU